jgi:hypothetical protein
LYISASPYQNINKINSLAKLVENDFSIQAAAAGIQGPAGGESYSAVGRSTWGAV